MSQLDVGQSDRLQGPEFRAYRCRFGFGLGAEEGYGLRHAHVQYIIYVLALVSDFEYVRFETLSTAGFADHGHVCHELHPYLHETVALTLRAASTLLVEGEEGRGVAVYLCILLVRHQFPDVVIYLEVGYGIRTGTLPYRVLVDIFDLGDAVEIAREPPEGSRKIA